MDLARTWISSGGQQNAGAEGVFKKYSKKVALRVMADLKQAAEELAKIAGGGKESGGSWKQDLRNNSGWSKLEEAFTEEGGLKDVKADDIENQLKDFKKDITHTCTQHISF